MTALNKLTDGQLLFRLQDVYGAEQDAIKINDHEYAQECSDIVSVIREVMESRKALEAAEKRIAEQSEIVAAAEKLVRCKGRYHSELNYRALAKLFGVTTPDLPPLKHENVHYADAAEMEIAALRQSIAGLEARTPYGYLRQCDGKIQISIGSERPHDRSGGYATPWFAIYTATGIGVKGD